MMARKQVKPRSPGAPRGRRRGTASLPCPHCGSDTEVAQTFRVETFVRRRRRCLHCRKYFYSVECTAEEAA